MQHRWVTSAAAGAVFGIALGTLPESPAAPAVPIALGVTLLCVAMFARSYRAALLPGAVALCCVGLGMLRGAAALEVSYPLAQYIGDGRTIEGVVARGPDRRESSVQYVVNVESVGGEAVAGKLLVIAPLYERASRGDAVTFTAAIERPAPFASESGRTFAYDRWLEKDGICCVARYPSDMAHTPPQRRRSVPDALDRAKRALVAGIAAALPEPHASLGAGILVGARNALPPATEDSFQAAGLSHIVVLSGYNMTIVAEVIARLCAALPPPLSLSLSAGSIVAFATMVGGGATVVRASIMALIAILAKATGRRYGAPRALVAAAAVMALHSPLIVLYDPGFQLSFIATLTLVTLAPIIEPMVTPLRSFPVLSGILASTLAAQIGVAPLLAYHMGTFSLVAPVANLAALPLVPAAMATSLVAGAAGMVTESVAQFVGFPAYVLLEWILRVASVAAAMPFAQLAVPLAPWWVVIGVYAAGAGAYALYLRRSKETAAGA